MKNILALFLLQFALASCEKPYDLVSQPKYYTGDPFVCLSSEQASIKVEGNNDETCSGIFRDSITLSTALDHSISVELELVPEETVGTLGTTFTFDDKISITAGSNYGIYYVKALQVPHDQMSQYKLSVRIKEVDDPKVIPGLFGIKKENEDRQKEFKSYSFQD